MNCKQEWAANKIATSKSIVEAMDELERGCDFFCTHGLCGYGSCDNCIMEVVYDATVKRLKRQKAVKTVNVTVYGGNVTINM